MVQMKEITAAVVEKTVELGRMLLNFGLVKRVTQHEDGVTYESDSTHTVMLGVMACAFAKEYVPDLDLGKVAQFALVHDLVEVYAGDTNTFGKIEHNPDKEEREREALARIKTEFDSVYPWLGDTITEYEQLASREARYIKVFDKILPKVTHLLNAGSAVRAQGQTKEMASAFIGAQIEKLAHSYATDQSEAMTLLKEMHAEFERKVFP
ncbi:MAG: hypothetical protein ABA06_03235 [Parcubacteria bacterium C7867-001]|nr:MAG: hypothetical protein ABA06_03235 [Parcubacteria bacterium C7867-001]